jgi:hypothetical protein
MVRSAGGVLLFTVHIRYCTVTAQQSQTAQTSKQWCSCACSFTPWKTVKSKQDKQAPQLQGSLLFKADGWALLPPVHTFFATLGSAIFKMHVAKNVQVVTLQQAVNNDEAVTLITASPGPFRQPVPIQCTPLRAE